uniref:Uncharacterized protein n=2 Tax=Wuchereria bancrofti TaxID=6293 RepID=A0A1I8EXK3_WUCBA
MSEQQISRESFLSSTICPYFDDCHPYRPVRSFTSAAPYRSSFHTSTISLPDIKEATIEQNDSSCSSSVEHNQKAVVNFHDQNTRKSLEQNLEPKSSNNFVAVDNLIANENVRRYCHEQMETETPCSADTSKSSTVQALYPSENTDVIINENQISHSVEKIQKPAISIIAVQITSPNSHRRIICPNQNETHRNNNKSKIVYKMDDFDSSSDPVISSRNLPDSALESLLSYSSDSSKQPKSILKQRQVAASLLSPSTCNISDKTSERYAGRVQISDNNDKEEKQQYNDQCCDISDRMSHSLNLNSNLTGRENRLYQIMQENLRQQKLLRRSETPCHLPQASFNGPFFTLEEVQIKQQRESLEKQQIPVEEYRFDTDYHLIRKEQQNSIDDSSRKLRYGSRSKSVSVMEMNAMEPEKNNEIKESVVVPLSSLPPIKQKHERARSVPPSLRTRNITDPDRINEYHRQKQLELEAMRLKEERAILCREKQSRALEKQERLYCQQMQAKGSRISPELEDSMTQSHEELQQIDISAQKRQKELYFEKNIEPQLMHVYETRPITATSESDAQGELICSPNSISWKRVYIVDQLKPVAKNEIITSEQLLEKERFNIDLLKRREAFIEKPRPEPVIFRTGKRWKPPPEQSYIWPYVGKALNAEPSLESSSNYSTDNAIGRTTEFQWQPVVYNPEYKQEYKDFSSENSFPDTLRGFGPGPLDESAKRQIKHLVQPLPDGSHRPKPAFGGPRATPSGGFYPHAPNAIKVLKKKHSQSLPESIDMDPDKEMEIIHHRKFHRFGELPSSRCCDIADWEKIYDLPVHSSTITSRDIPRNVNVRGKLAAFENKLRLTTPSVHLRSNTRDTRCPQLSSIRATNIDDNLQSSDNKQMNRNRQYLRQQKHRQQQFSPNIARTDNNNYYNHRSYQLNKQQRNERQIISSSGSLAHHIDHCNINQSNRLCSINHPDNCYQFNREMLSQKLTRPMRDPSDYNQYRIPVFRSDRTSTPYQQQQLVAQSAISQASPRRLTRIPMNYDVDRSNPQVIDVQRLPSRFSTNKQWVTRTT